MQKGEISQILLHNLQVPVITGTSPTLSGRQLMKSAILFIGRYRWHTIKHRIIPLDTKGFT